MSAPFVLINDAFVPTEQAVLHVSDLAIQRGYGIFDFFQTVNGRPAFLDDHLDRFYHSAARMRLEIGKSREELKGLLQELVRRNGIANSGVRITLTGGYSPDAYSIAKPNLVVTQSPLKIDAGLMERGMRLVTYAHRRQFADVKTLDYLMAVWLQPFVREHGADDVLYQLNGAVSECPRSNFSIVTREGRVITPAEHVLKGIVRKQVLRIAPARYAAEEGTVTLEDIRGAKEAFVTSTTKGVMPVVEVDGRPVGDGRPGEVTRWLGREFNALLASATA
jgi:D-alanine transaminase/branched-chain amino acid aminotransferase